MAESLHEFLQRVHRDDVETGKDVMHKPGDCDICDEHRARREAS
jgi:hypothetical protein